MGYDLTSNSKTSFAVRYQILRLAQNGKLPPDKTRDLISTVAALSIECGEAATIAAIRQLYLHLVPVGPQTQAHDYLLDSLAKLLARYAREYDLYKEQSPCELANRHAHIVLVHKIQVPPAGVYLEGPEPEVTNRVSLVVPLQTVGV